MRRKAIIVFTITFMVTVMVAFSSYLYVSQSLRLRIANDYDEASRLAQTLAYFADNDLPDLTSTRIDTNNPAAVQHALAEYLPMDTNLQNNLQSDTGLWDFIYDASVVDSNSKALLHSNPKLVGKQVPDRPDFLTVRNARFLQQFRLAYAPATVYDVTFPLDLNGQSFGTIRMGISTAFLRNELTPHLRRAVFFSIASIFASLLLAAMVSNFALGPLKRINQNLDSVTLGEADQFSGKESQHDEYGLVSLKIANLGRQMRDTKEIFTALKDNVDQLMSNLQDGLMLFTRDSRVVLVSAPVERFLGTPRGQLLGRTAREIFSNDSALGTTVLDAFDRRRPFSSREFIAAGGRRVQVSLDFIQEKTTQIGALLVMRDAESVRRIGDEIETSRRLSASGRVTGGVAHEVKNPINAIVLHLQLLQNKLSQIDPDTRRHMDIIGSEIQRLDRVVQTLVDFMRARELHLEEIELRSLLEDVAGLATPDAEARGVTIHQSISDEPLPIKADVDLIKQALLNVVLNGVQAMPEGGPLTISAHREGNVVVAEITDGGVGIPEDMHEKVFELYFTTKKEGSGIGLARTYQILQWHYGSIEFESREGEGTTFRFRIPISSTSLDSEPEHFEDAFIKPR
ncbi:MAG: ATP-binding protein [Candidatus Sulfotelmatobacter sp.]|jgi:signal transduction histidine kinase